MKVESLLPFLLILVKSLGIAFFLEALVIYFFKIKRFWPAVGTAVVVNFVAFLIVIGTCSLIGKLGYEFNGLQFPVQVIVALWWISVITDALLLQLFARKTPQKTIYLSSIVMNAVSYLFLGLFIVNSH